MDNPRIAASVLRHCAREGVREYCLAAGARNAPLALALVAGIGNPERVYHFFDERAAGFFALGRSLATRRPVAVVTTSGTAVAELLPAMVEAHYQGAPLVAVTADRPASFRGSGAPQAIEQPGIFGVYADSIEVAMEEDGVVAIPSFNNKPMHLNVPLGEPTTGVESGEGQKDTGRGNLQRKLLGISVFGREAIGRFLSEREGLAVVVGSLHPNEAEQVGRFLQKLGAPVYAEPASNLRGNPSIRSVEHRGRGREWVALTGRTGRILRIGGVPVSRWWRDLEHTDHEILNLSPSGHPGISRACECVRVEDFSALDEVKISEPNSSVGVEFRNLDGLISNCPCSEPALIRAISKIIPSGNAVFLGNSLPVRDWDLAAVPPEPETAFFANRGANGIDGALSTALGVGADFLGIWAVVGDLTALYDLSAPWVIPQLQKHPKVRIVVINNGGGKIFSHLPALAGIGEDADRMIQNQHALRFESWAAMWDFGYAKVENPEDLQGFMADGLPDRIVLETVPNSEETERFWAAFRKL